MTQINVPRDGSCLFWSTALPYLISVKDDDNSFQQRYTTLFGYEQSGYKDHVRELIQNYNPFPLLNEVSNDDTFKDDTLKNLVENIFRKWVVEHIKTEEPQTSKSSPEIEAMGRMLEASINVSGITQN